MHPLIIIKHSNSSSTFSPVFFLFFHIFFPFRSPESGQSIWFIELRLFHCKKYRSTALIYLFLCLSQFSTLKFKICKLCFMNFYTDIDWKLIKTTNFTVFIKPKYYLSFNATFFLRSINENSWWWNNDFLTIPSIF